MQTDLGNRDRGLSEPVAQGIEQNTELLGLCYIEIRKLIAANSILKYHYHNGADIKHRIECRVSTNMNIYSSTARLTLDD